MGAGWRGHWADGAFFAGALAVWALWGLQRSSDDGRPGNSPRLLGHFEIGRVSGATLEEGGQAFRLERLGDRSLPVPLSLASTEWVVVGPELALADQARVNTWLEALAVARSDRPLPPPAVEPSTGTRVQVWDDRLRWTLALGAEAQVPPGARLIWAQSSAEAAQVVAFSGEEATALLPSAADLLDSLLMPVGSASLSELSLVQGSLGWHLERQRDGFVFKPDGERVGRAPLQALLLSLARARLATVQWPTGTATSAGASDQEVARLSLRWVSGATSELRFFERCASAVDAIGVSRDHPPLRGCLERHWLQELLPTRESLADARLVAAYPQEVRRLSFGAGDQWRSLRRAEGSFASDDGTVLTESDVRPRLERLCSLSAARVAKPAAPGPALVTIVVASQRAEDAPLIEENLVLYAGGYVERTVDGAWLRLAPEAFEAVRPDSRWLRSLQVWDYPEGAIREVALERNGRPWQRFVQSPEGELRLSHPPAPAIDVREARRVLEKLAHLRARDWVSIRLDRAPFGLERPSLRVVLRLEQGGRALERIVDIGGKAPGGYFAAVDRQPGVFLLASADLRLLSTLLVEPTLLPLDQVGSWLSVQPRGGEESWWVRQADGWTAEPGKLPNTEFLEQLRGRSALLANAVIDVRPPLALEGLAAPLWRLRLWSSRHDATPSLSVAIGVEDLWEGRRVHYASRSDSGAIYALEHGVVESLFSTW